MATREWQAVEYDGPEEEPEYPEDPQDWKFALELNEGDITHEVIFITFTGTTDDDDHVIATPVDTVNQRIQAMLNGLNAELNAGK